jgi:hypothetical protein
MAGGLGLSLAGLQYLDVGTSALIFYTMPLWLVAIEWTIDRQKQSLLDVIALTCGMLGLGLLASGAIPVATSHGILGIALLSMAAFSWALGTWIHKRYPGDSNVWSRTIFQLATSGVVVIVASLLLERRLDWTQLPILAWPIAFNCIVATGLAFVAWYRALSSHFHADRISEPRADPCRRAGCGCVLATGRLHDTRRARLCPHHRRCHHRNLAAVKGADPCECDPRARKPAIGTEHHMEPGDAGFDTSLSPDEDRRRGCPCGLDDRRAEPFYRAGIAAVPQARPEHVRRAFAIARAFRPKLTATSGRGSSSRRRRRSKQTGTGLRISLHRKAAYA